MTHLYKVGQLLELTSAPRHSNRPAGLCEVVFCLPHDTGPVLYRVKARGENVERVVQESDLTPSKVQREEEAGATASPFSIAISKR